MKKNLFLLFVVIIFSFFFWGEANAGTEILRPSGPGSETNLDWDYYCGYKYGKAHWECAADVLPDGCGNVELNGTCVGSNIAAYRRDLYTLSNHSVSPGTINKVTIYMTVGTSFSGPANFKPSLRTHGSTYDGAEVIVSSAGWITRSQEWVKNPFTDSAWTWQEIDDLEIGVSAKWRGTTAQVTQVYAEVDYTPLSCQTHNISGYAWSENIGWVSFSCEDTLAPYDYGVDIDGSGNFSGYAWSENIGWISFAPAGPYPASPNYSAQIDMDTGEVSGWARVLAFGGGWDGWLKLRGTNYGVLINKATGNFSGYAWSDMVIGWVSFSGVDYRVITSYPFNEPPDSPGIPDEYKPTGASWDNCTFQGQSIPTFHWTYSDPDGDPQTAYEVEIDDNASFHDPKFNHLVSNAATSYALDLNQDDNSDWISELAWNTTYQWRVRVEDDHNNWSNWSSAHSFKTPNHVYPYPGFSWDPQEPNQKEVVVFTPDQTGLEYLWTVNEETGTGYEFVDGTDILDEEPHIKFLTPDNKIKLEVTDGDAYSCESAEQSIEAQLPLPEYKEIPPIIWLKKSLGTLASLLDGLYFFGDF